MSKDIVHFISRDVYYFVKDYNLRYVDFHEGFESNTSNLPISDIQVLVDLFDEDAEFIDEQEFEIRKLNYVTNII